MNTQKRLLLDLSFIYGNSIVELKELQKYYELKIPPEIFEYVGKEKEFVKKISYKIVELEKNNSGRSILLPYSQDILFKNLVDDIPLKFHQDFPNSAILMESKNYLDPWNESIPLNEDLMRWAQGEFNKLDHEDYQKARDDKNVEINFRSKTLDSWNPDRVTSVLETKGAHFGNSSDPIKYNLLAYIDYLIKREKESINLRKKIVEKNNAFSWYEISPYFSYCFKIHAYFHRNFILKRDDVKISNPSYDFIDFCYLLYLPFADYFVTNDKKIFIETCKDSFLKKKRLSDLKTILGNKIRNGQEFLKNFKNVQ